MLRPFFFANVVDVICSLWPTAIKQPFSWSAALTYDLAEAFSIHPKQDGI